MQNSRLEVAKNFKHKAQLLLKQGKSEEAFGLFDKAGGVFKDFNDHHNAAECFASAGTCWCVHLNEELFFNAATRYQYAGEEAALYYNYDYSRYLFQQAAKLFLKDGSFHWVSYCLYLAGECERKNCWLHVINSRKLRSIPGRGYKYNFLNQVKYFFKWLLATFFWLIWGYGERPFRTLAVSLLMVFISSLIFSASNSLEYKEAIINPNFIDSLYFSVVTFTTLGYGDYQPIGIYRLISMVEAFGALFLMPLFIIGLTRKFVRHDN